MEPNRSMLGTLKIRVVRGIDIAIRDFRTSDPYMVVTMGGDQKLRTKTITSNCNPEWNEELTFSVFDPKLPIKLQVFDEDTFSRDDHIGDAKIDIRPYLESVEFGEEFGLDVLPIGTAMRKVQPSGENDLVDESRVVWVGNGGKMVQDMILKLRNVEKGKVQVQIIEWNKKAKGGN